MTRISFDEPSVADVNFLGAVALTIVNRDVAIEATSREGIAGILASGERDGMVGTGHRGVGVQGNGQEAGVRGNGHFLGVVGQSDVGSGVSADSNQNTALIATTAGGDATAFIVNQRGNGRIMIGRNADNAEVFAVLLSGDIQVRGVTLTSDKNAKTNFSNVNSLQILDKLARMPIQSWSYKTDTTGVHHIGPTSQDFQAAFGLNGEDDAHIASIDAHGVALAAIQGLNKRLSAENAQLRAHLVTLEARLAALEQH